jgi:hypothetical protein
MGRKSTPAEKAERALLSGFNDDMSGIDSDIVFRPITPWTEKAYLQQWHMWPSVWLQSRAFVEAKLTLGSLL